MRSSPGLDTKGSAYQRGCGRLRLAAPVHYVTQARLLAGSPVKALPVTDCAIAVPYGTFRTKEGIAPMIDTASAKTLLEERMAELRSRQERIARDLAEPLNADSSEQATEVEDDTALEGQAALIEREIASVYRALGRLEKGTYGECARCGSTIAAARLKARPEAALCIACASSEQ